MNDARADHILAMAACIRNDWTAADFCRFLGRSIGNRRLKSIINGDGLHELREDERSRVAAAAEGRVTP